MKRALGFSILGGVLAILIYLNIERVTGGRFVPGKGPALPAAPSVRLPPAQAGSTTAAAAAVDPAVVNIDTVGRPVAVQDWGFFGGGMRFVTPQGSGSGVIVRDDGFIVTNNHVIEGADTIKVTMHDGRKLDGRVWGRDPNYDLAVVKVNATGLPRATLGNSDDVRVGDPVIAVGNALGLGATVTSGIVSAQRREVKGLQRSEGLAQAIQTDAAINRGNSGGALALLNGQVIGINTAIVSTGQEGGNIGIGFAIPSNTVRRVTEELIRNRQVTRPSPAWLGIQYFPLSPEVAEQLMGQLGLEYPANDKGVIVQNVIPGGPAARAGIKSYDNILEMDKKVIDGTNALADIVKRKKPGDVAEIVLWRPATNKRMSLKVTLSAAPETQPAEAPRRGLRLPF